MPDREHPNLLLCPFCGAAPKIERWHGGDTGHTRIVGCVDEDCDVQPSVTGATAKIAAERWNRRAPTHP